jgi:hypothetical protein
MNVGHRFPDDHCDRGFNVDGQRRRIPQVNVRPLDSSSARAERSSSSSEADRIPATAARTCLRDARAVRITQFRAPWREDRDR